MPQDSSSVTQPPHPVTTPATAGPSAPSNQNQSPAVPPPNQNFPQGPPNQDYYNRPDQVRIEFQCLIFYLNVNYV
jgi:hypothetical protein